MRKRLSGGRLSYLIWLGLILAALPSLSACRPDDWEAIVRPPRLATQTAQSQASLRTVTPPPSTTAPPAPTAPLPVTELAPASVNPRLTVWINGATDTERAALAQIGDGFTAAAQIQVEFVLIEPDMLPELMATAALSATLPDLVLHPVEYSLLWTQQGILNSDAAQRAVAQLGQDTFAPGALAWVTTAAGQPAALPSDGWQQLLLYRQDWFRQAQLPAPTDFQTMLAGAQAFFNLDQVITGFVGATDANTRDTQRLFEHLATANGCQLIDPRGELRLLEPACEQALNFYYALVFNYSPPGVQTEISALKAYLAGRTAMIITKPQVLPMLTGLNADFPPRCPECADDPLYLAQNTGFVTQVSGYITTGVPANFSEANYLGITTTADETRALAFVDYWFNAGYETWLAAAPEMKSPLRQGSAENPTAFLDAWRALPLAGSNQSLTQLFQPALADQLSRDLTRAPRWAFRQGQGALLGHLYAENSLSPLLQRLLSGYINPSETLLEAYLGAVKFIPDYPYLPEGLPTPDRSGG